MSGQRLLALASLHPSNPGGLIADKLVYDETPGFSCHARCDMAGAHGMVWKSTQAFYDDVALVPLIVSWPEAVRRSRSDAAVSLVDMAPALLELTGQPVPASMQGISFAPLLKGGSRIA